MEFGSVVIDVLGIATLLAVLLLGAVMILYNSRQATALKEAAGVIQDWYILQVKDRRDEKLKNINVSDPFAWIGSQIDCTITGVHRQLDKPMAISFETANGVRVVVSPLGAGALRRALKPIESGTSVVNQITEPLLGRNGRSLATFERNILNAGEWFDEEARQAGEALGINWGAPGRLYFYLVPVK